MTRGTHLVWLQNFIEMLSYTLKYFPWHNISSRVKKKEDNVLILFSALDSVWQRHRYLMLNEHKSIFFLLVEVIFYTYINEHPEHSEDSRHVSISILLNDLTWLELQSATGRCCSITQPQEMNEDQSFSAAPTLKTMKRPADHSLSVAKDHKRLSVCLLISCFLTSSQFQVQMGVTLYSTTWLHY